MEKLYTLTDLVHAEEIVIIGTLQAVVPGQAAAGATAGLIHGQRGCGAGGGGGGNGGQYHGDNQHPAIIEHLSLLAH